jgi:hypothetical protein
MSALQLDQQPGRCAFCDAPLKQPRGKGRRRTVMCGAAECYRDYLKAYAQQKLEVGARIRAVVYRYGAPGAWKDLLECGHSMPALRRLPMRASRRCVHCCDAATAKKDAEYLQSESLFFRGRR